MKDSTNVANYRDDDGVLVNWGRGVVEFVWNRAGPDGESVPLGSVVAPAVGSREESLGSPLRKYRWLWIGSAAAFAIIAAILGGPGFGDADQWYNSSLAIAHGHFSCAYPPSAAMGGTSGNGPTALAAPLFPLLVGAFAFAMRIGSHVVFPSGQAMGVHCQNAFKAIDHWSLAANVFGQLIRLSYIVWLPLMMGVAATLRAMDRGRAGWEPLALMMIVVTPPLYDGFVFHGHPQDLLALGLSFWGVAYFRRGSWVWAGAMIGLALTTQQFALLVAIPLLVVAPRSGKLRFLGGAVGAFGAVVVPLTIATSGRVLRSVFFGSSRISLLHVGKFHSYGGTVLAELHLHGVVLFVVTRLCPLVGALVLALWARRRLGPAVLEPIPLISLVGASLALRVVFEENFFGYYLLALAVALIVLDTVRGRIRGPVVAWIAATGLAFNPIFFFFGYYKGPWGFYNLRLYPITFLVVVIVAMVKDLRTGRVQIYLVLSLALVVTTSLNQLLGVVAYDSAVPKWLWQVILVPTGLALVASPLFSLTRRRPHRPSPRHS